MLTKKQAKLASTLTFMQCRFVLNLVAGMTKGEALRAAGSKIQESNLVRTAHYIFTKKNVKAFYNSLLSNKLSSVIKDTILKRDEALEILTNNARAKITDIGEFKQIEIGRDADDHAIFNTVFIMHDSKQINENIIAAIKSVTLTSSGVKFELHDQQQAVKQITEMQGWNSANKHEISGADGGAIPITVIERKIIN